MKHFALFLCSLAVIAFATVGCDKKEGGSDPAAKTADKGGETAKKDEGKKESGSAGAGKIGVPACDEYVEKMTACLEKMPAASRDAVKSAFEKSIETWSKLEGPAKEALGSGCKTALDAAKSSYKAMGCEF